jgi:hypothetical protein
MDVKEDTQSTLKKLKAASEQITTAKNGFYVC